MISNGDIVGYENNGDFRGVVLENLLELFTERAMISIVRMPSKKITKIAIPSTTDTEADKMTHILVSGKTKGLKELAPVNKKTIKPLFLFLDKEVMLYCKLMKLKCKKTKEEKDKLGKFVDDLEKKHPEIKHSIVKSYLELYPE
jgi:tRNA(Ile)-lysidine synthase TilS/MesJ